MMPPVLGVLAAGWRAPAGPWWPGFRSTRVTVTTTTTATRAATAAGRHVARTMWGASIRLSVAEQRSAHAAGAVRGADRREREQLLARGGDGEPAGFPARVEFLLVGTQAARRVDAVGGRAVVARHARQAGLGQPDVAVGLEDGREQAVHRRVRRVHPASHDVQHASLSVEVVPPRAPGLDGAVAVDDHPQIRGMRLELAGDVAVPGQREPQFPTALRTQPLAGDVLELRPVPRLIGVH